MLIDTSKLPLPGAETEPGLKSWLAYLETIRPLVEGEYFARLTPSQKQAAELQGGIEYPAMESVVPFEIFDQKRQMAKVLAWEKEKAGYAAKKAAPSAMDSYKPVLVGNRTGVVGVFDFDTWTWDAQWDLWEDQLKPEAHAKLAGDSTHANLAGDPKADLLLFYLEEVLPLTTEKASVFPVLFFLLKHSPEDLRSFKTSHQEIAKGSGAGVRSVQRAIAFLEEKNLLAVAQEPWSPKKSSRAEYTLLPLAKVKHTPSWLESSR